MAVPTTNAFDGPYEANGVATTFPFSFTALSSGDVGVQIDGVAATGYSVTLSPVSGGFVTFDSAPVTGTIYIVLQPAFTQNTKYEDGAAWLAGPHNAALDRAALRDQALLREISQAIRFPLGDAGFSLPPAEVRAGCYLAFGPNGEPILVDGTSLAPGPAQLVGNNFDRGMKFTGPFSLTSLGNTSPANGTFAGFTGNSLSFTTRFSTPSGGNDSDNQRASLLVAATTSDDANSEEQTLCILTTSQTGYAPGWSTSTAYALDDVVRNVATNGIYKCTVAGTSASSGPGPSGKSINIADGTVRWKWINDAAIYAKVGIYNEIEVKPGAADSWAQANNILVRPGVNAASVFNTELDFTNNCGTDSVIGGPDKYVLGMYIDGTNTITAGIEVSGRSNTNWTALWGLKFDGLKLASRAVIGVDASGGNGLAFGTSGGGVADPTYTGATIRDSSNSVWGVKLEGTYSSSGIDVSCTGPASITMNGTRAVASIRDATTSPTGLLLSGTYADFSIFAPGFSVGPAGETMTGKFGANGTLPIAKPTITGSRGGNAALANLLTALANYGLITDSTT